MLHYFKEAKEGDAFAVSCHLLEHDDKRMQLWLEMTARGGERLAASEQLLISVALGEARRARRPVELRDEGRAGGARQSAERPAPSPPPPGPALR